MPDAFFFNCRHQHADIDANGLLWMGASGLACMLTVCLALSFIAKAAAAKLQVRTRLALALGQAASLIAARNKHVLWLQGCHLVPILAFGPSNQFVGLQEAAALALLLKCKLVIYGFHNQYREARGSGKDVIIPFDAFFQRLAKTKETAVCR